MVVKKYIGFDLGAESGRCVVGTLQNGMLTLSEVHRFQTPSLFFRGHFFWNILGIVQEIETGLREVVRQFGPEFDGISVDTWGVDYVLLDGDDRVLGFPYHYRDGRTKGQIEKALRKISKPELYALTGTQFAPFNTLYQLLAEMEQTSNWLTFSRRLLFMPDFLLFVLSGVAKAEYTIASTSNLIHPKTRSWSNAVLELFEIPKPLFPEIIEPGTVLGPIDSDLADRTGLAPTVPVIASASHDTAAAVASVPALGGNWAFLSSGTWSLMGVELKHPVLTEEALRFNFTNEGGVNKTIRFLKNIMGLWPIQECRRFWQGNGQGYSYEELKTMAAENGPANAWIDVDDWRFLQAGQMPEKIAQFFQETGQLQQESKGWLIRSVLESLAFKYRMTIQELERVTGQKIDVLHAVGGGIQNDLLNQLTADAIDREVVIGPVEGTIVGNIGMQAIARGDLASVSELRETVRESFPLQKILPKNPGYFEKNEKRFREILGGKGKQNGTR